MVEGLLNERWRKRKSCYKKQETCWRTWSRGFDTTTAMRRDDDTTTNKNDTVAVARCDEERIETKTGRGREFSVHDGKGNPEKQDGTQQLSFKSSQHTRRQRM